MTRLRRGELIAGAAALALLVLMFAAHWYGLPARGRALSGWQALAHVRWVLLVTGVAALTLVAVQVTRRAPALPVVMSVTVTLLGLLSSIWLLYRVVVNAPPHQTVAAPLGLLSACAIAIGGYLSLHDEGVAPVDEKVEIPLVNPHGRSDS